MCLEYIPVVASEVLAEYLKMYRIGTGNAFAIVVNAEEVAGIGRLVEGLAVTKGKHLECPGVGIGDERLFLIGFGEIDLLIVNVVEAVGGWGGGGV